MALVRISKELINEVEVKVNDMRRRELSQLPSISDMVVGNDHPDFALYKNLVETQAWALAPHLRSVMPTDWLVKPHAVDVHYKRGGGLNTNRYQQDMQFRLQGDVYFPPGSSNYPDVYLKDDVPKLNHILDSKEEIKAKRGEVAEKYSAIMTQVVSFLRSQKSLNAALKVHPNLALYIEQWRIDKINEVVTRGEKESAEEVTIDINAITAAAVAHTIASSGA